MSCNFSIKSLLTVVILLVASVARSQNDIGVTLNIVPPYSTKIMEYVETPGKVLLIVRNNTNQAKNIYMAGTITGDNGVNMYNDPKTKPSSPVTLQPFQVLNVSNAALQDLFSVQKYKMTGITLTDLLTKNGLPEGNYNICIRAYDYSTGAPLSGDAPQGCKMVMMANLEPPFPLKPLADEEVKGFEPQNVIFTWTVPAGSEPGTQYKLKVIEMLNPAKNINDAFNSATTPTFFETTVPSNVFVYGPAQPKLVPGRKYAWAVSAIPGPKKTAYKNNGRSEVRSFIFGKVEPPKPAGPVITLVAPADKASFPAIGGTNTSIDLKWDYTNPNKTGFYEDAWVYEVKPGQTPEEAVKKNERLNSTKEPYKSAGFSGTTLDGKTYAWVVTLNDAGKIYTSAVKTFSIGASAVAGQTFQDFEFGGYPVHVNSLKELGGYKYSGTGYTELYKGGPSVTLWFQDITIKPFKKSGKDFSDWRAVSGSVKSKPLYKAFMYYTLPNDIDGELRFQADALELKAAMKTESKSDGTFYTTDTYGEHGAKIDGTFTWETYYVYKAENGEEKTALYTCKVYSKFDYNKRFSETENFYLMLKTPDGYNTMKLVGWAGTTLKLVPTLRITDNGKTPKFKFDGYYEIPKLKNGKPGITVNFSQKETMQFTQPISYSIPVTTDGSVVASFDKVDLYIGNLPSIKIPELQMKFTQDGKSYSFNFTKAFFSGNDGLYCKEKKLAKGDVNIGGFPVTFKESTITMVKSRLLELKISGTFDIPFIKQKGEAVFYATEEGIQSAGVSCDLTKLTVLYQNIEGDKCSLQPSWGTFMSNRIVLSGELYFSNINDKEKNFNIAHIPMPDFYIKANGDVGIENGNLSGGLVSFQVPGTYNGFKFSPFEINLSKVSAEKYKIAMNGMLVMADNLASDSKIPNFSTSVTFDASTIKGGGPPPNQEVAFNSSEVSGGRHDGAVDFGVKFKYYNNDPIYGKGFMSEGYFGVQQPNPMQVHAKMIVARAPGGYNYWFFEAGQENVMQIPTGVLDVGIYGFTGRVYYKMAHKGTNINKDDYQPDNSKFIGIYGLTQLKTLTDNGVKFWGKVGFEVVTNKWGLESVSFRGDGELMSDGVGTNGMIRAHDCRLNFCWSPKEVYGDFPVSANFKNMVSAEADLGFDITPSSIEIWGSASSASLFQSPACGSSNFGFHLTQDNANLYGYFNLIKIHKGFDFGICEPDIDVYAHLLMDAYVNYSPFQFKGNGEFHGHIHVAGCKLSGNIGLHLVAQMMFPQPTCISAGIEIETPLKDFGLHAGLKDGSIIFKKCFN